MISLCIHSLLKSNKKTWFEIVSSLEKTKLEPVTWYLSHFDEEFHVQERLKLGQSAIGVLPVGEWQEVIRYILDSEIYVPIANALKVDKSEIVNSPVVHTTIVQQLAGKLSNIVDFRGINLSKQIEVFLKELSLQNKKLFLEEVSSSQTEVKSGKLIDFYSLDDFERSEDKVIRWDLLRQVRGEQFHIVFDQISRAWFTKNKSEESEAAKYSLFSAYINMQAEQWIEDQNLKDKHYPIIEINNVCRPNEELFFNIDSILKAVWPYILRTDSLHGIKNFVEKFFKSLLSITHVRNTEIQRANTKKTVKFKTVDTEEGQGLFGTNRTVSLRDLKKETSLSDDIFTMYVLGFKAIGVLHKWLINANVESLKFHPNLCDDMYPTQYFTDLEELVLYHRIFCEKRIQYKTTSGDVTLVNSWLDKKTVFEKKIVKYSDTLFSLTDTLNFFNERNITCVLLEKTIVEIPFYDICQCIMFGYIPIISCDPDFGEGELEDSFDRIISLIGYDFTSKYLKDYNDLDDLLDEHSVVSDDYVGYEFQEILIDLFRFGINAEFVNFIGVLANKLGHFLSQLNNNIDPDLFRLKPRIEIVVKIKELNLFSEFDNIELNSDTSIKDIITVFSKEFISEKKDEMIEFVLGTEQHSRVMVEFCSRLQTNFGFFLNLLNSLNYYLIGYEHSQFSQPITNRNELLKLITNVVNPVDRDKMVAYIRVYNLVQDSLGYLKNKDNLYCTRNFANTYGYLHSLGVLVVDNKTVVSAEEYLDG